jgi:Kef-type K+ transport system membrane component KefB
MFQSLTLLVLAGLAGPLLASGRRQLVPVLVGELIAGALLGNTGLRLLHPGVQPFPAFMTLGFAMLMLQAGSEVDIMSPLLRRGAARGAVAVLLALAAAVPAGLAVASIHRVGHQSLLIVLIAGSSAAVALPAIQERRLTGPTVGILIAWIAMADVITALLMPLTLTGASGIPVALAGDALIVVAAALSWLAARRLFATRLAEQATRWSKTRRWALQLRLSVLLLLVLATISEYTGASLLLAGFVAGIVLREFHEPQRLELQLTGLATGFFVPAFFVLLGASLDLGGLARSPSAIGLSVAMAAAATLVHVLAALAAGTPPKLPAGLLASAQLGLPAAAAALGLSTGMLSPPLAAALVAGGLITLLPASLGAVLLAHAEAGAGKAAPEAG